MPRKKLHGVWTEGYPATLDGTAHRVDPHGFRMTVCGEITGIVFYRRTVDEVQADFDDLCPICWDGIVPVKKEGAL